MMAAGPVAAVLPLVLVLVCVALLLALVRLVLGPTLPDRVVALDLMGITAVAFTTIYAIQAGEPALLDAAIVMALVAFLGTVAFARYIIRRGQP